MKKRQMSNIEVVGIIFLLVVAIGCGLYYFVYTPIKDETAQIKTQAEEMDQKIQLAAAKLSKMNSMKAELEAIFAENDDPSEIAAFDNYQNVFSQLNGILSTTKDYSLGFSDTETDASNGIIRRRVSLSYSVDTYEEAKNILMALEQNHWRCVLDSLSISTSGTSEDGIITEGELTVSASLVFFESSKIAAE